MSHYYYGGDFLGTRRWRRVQPQTMPEFLEALADHLGQGRFVTAWGQPNAECAAVQRVLREEAHRQRRGG